MNRRSKFALFFEQIFSQKKKKRKFTSLISSPGRPGSDYPVLSVVPYTDFYCDEQPYPGFFADPETRCQAWHYCDIDGRQASFLCPNGTQFSQAVLVCDWWFNVRSVSGLAKKNLFQERCFKTCDQYDQPSVGDRQKMYIF